METANLHNDKLAVKGEAHVRDYLGQLGFRTDPPLGRYKKDICQPPTYIIVNQFTEGFPF